MTYGTHLTDDSEVISVRMSKDQARELKALARRLNTNRNNLINKAITHYLAMIEEFNTIDNDA